MNPEIAKALRLLKKDPKFAALIKRYGPPTLRRPGTPFRALCRAIVYQQLSGKAAATIFARFIKLFPGKRFPTPADVLALPVEALRSAGLSAAKAAYIRDLAQKFTDGTITHRALRYMGNDELIEHLVAVKGIGEWTAHMFLIFTLERLDVLPTGDLGVRRGFQKFYGLKQLPTVKEMEKLAASWRQYASIVSWYFWRLAEEK